MQNTSINHSQWLKVARESFIAFVEHYYCECTPLMIVALPLCVTSQLYCTLITSVA